jgi:hypothetical protein
MKRKVNSKKMLASLILAIIFSSSVFFLSQTTSAEKLFSFQNDAFIHFISQLEDKDLAEATKSALSFLWKDAVSNLFVFVNIAAIGFLAFLLFSDRIDIRFFVLFNVVAGIILLAATGFSLLVLFAFLGTTAAVIWLNKTFGEKEGHFLTGLSFVRHGLKLLTTAVVIGFLVIIFTNISKYQAIASSASAGLIDEILPMSIKDMKKEEIGLIVDGLELGLEQQYQLQSSDVKAVCQPMYTSMVTGLENFRQEEERMIDEMDISGYAETTLPGYSVFNKMTPLFSALGLLIVFGIINSVCSLGYGLVYIGVRKFYTPEQSKTSSSDRA